MASLEFQNVTKRFSGGGVGADGVSLFVGDGEFIGLLGPSGCGKTTLLRLAAGLETPDAGNILIGGADMAGVPPRKRRVAMVFQDGALYEHMDVRRNIAVALESRALPQAETDRLVEQAAQALGIGQLLSRRPSALSGGERQRAALARAMVCAPQLLLLDEPLTGLDERTRGEAARAIAALHKATGVTTLFVTHDRKTALALCGRIALLCCGKIEQCGAPQELLGAPASDFVRDFFAEVPLV